MDLKEYGELMKEAVEVTKTQTKIQYLEATINLARMLRETENMKCYDLLRKAEEIHEEITKDFISK